MLLTIFSVLLLTGCLQKQEIKLDMSCDAEGTNEICGTSCQGNFSASAETWRCSGDGHPVCICESYKDADKYVANP